MARLAPIAARLGFRSGGRRWRVGIDAVVVAWLAWGFDAINNLGGVRQRLAEQHGGAVLDLERAVHLAPELALNTWLAARPQLSRLAVLYYDNVHAAVTFGVIAWLWWRRPDLLAPLRAALIAVNLVALAVFWSWPVAPPRMLPHPSFVDVVAVVGGGGAHWPPGAVSLDANQLSALPSLHIAWAVWSAIALWRLCTRRWARTLAVVYPVPTVLAVMATANHYLADAVTGAVLAAGAVAAADRAYRYAHRRRSGRLAIAGPTQSR